MRLYTGNRPGANERRVFFCPYVWNRVWEYLTESGVCYALCPLWNLCELGG